MPNDDLGRRIIAPRPRRQRDLTLDPYRTDSSTDKTETALDSIGTAANTALSYLARWEAHETDSTSFSPGISAGTSFYPASSYDTDRESILGKRSRFEGHQENPKLGHSSVYHPGHVGEREPKRPAWDDSGYQPPGHGETTALPINVVDYSQSINDQAQVVSPEGYWGFGYEIKPSPPRTYHKLSAPTEGFYSNEQSSYLPFGGGLDGQSLLNQPLDRIDAASGGLDGYNTATGQEDPYYRRDYLGVDYRDGKIPNTHGLAEARLFEPPPNQWKLGDDFSPIGSNEDQKATLLDQSQRRNADTKICPLGSLAHGSWPSDPESPFYQQHRRYWIDTDGGEARETTAESPDSAMLKRLKLEGDESK
jgi:hypothetical protein